jgi:hypothetical protein
MTLQSNNCNTAIVPQYIQTTGIPADLAVFITSQTVEGMESLEAWSTPCSINPLALNRVNFAQLNILPSKVGTDTYMWSQLYETLLHEMIHILGFNPILFQYFVDSNGNALGVSNIIM